MATTRIMRSAFFWDFTQHIIVIPYLRFGITYWSHFQVSCRSRTWPSTARSLTEEHSNNNNNNNNTSERTNAKVQ